ncbi:MAG: thioredoxin family protein [Porticoccaceae bacterium]|nr:thioredoxin family protein [Porticoccaceae bacterium]
MKLLKFYSDTCAPCKAYSPLIDDVTEALNIEVLPINIIDNPNLTAAHRIRSIPALVSLNDKGEALGSLVGTKTRAELTKWLEHSAV